MLTTMPRWMRLAAWCHRQCLRLAPLRFRQQFASDTDEAFAQFVDDTRRDRGTARGVLAAAAGILDAAGAAMRERGSDASQALVGGLLSDIARAPRVYWRAPIIAAAITLILAVASGPVVALCTVIYQGVLAPLPYASPDRLVVVTHQSQYGRNLYLRSESVNDYRQVGGFVQVAGIRPLGNRVTFNGKPRYVQTFQISAGTLSTLGTPLAAGRDLQRGDADVVVVTRGFALAHFGSVDAALGKTISLARGTPIIVGVLGQQPRMPGPMEAPELFTPHPTADSTEILRGRNGSQAIVIARLRDGVTIEEAEAEVRSVAAGVRATHGGDDVDPALEPLAVAVGGPMRMPMLLLFATVGALFIIAATSLGSLVLARAASRVPDIVLRRALGATRWRLTRVWALEGLILAAPGVLLGVWFGVALLQITRSALPPGMIPGLEASNNNVLLWTSAGVLLVMTTATFALAPVVAGLLRASATSSTHGSQVAGLRRMRAQNLLILGQVSLSVVMVTSTLWLSVGLHRTLSRPVGFEPEGLVTIRVNSIRDSTRDARLVATARDALAARFGAANVASSRGIPGVNTSGSVASRIRADEDLLPENARPTLVEFPVSSNYFSLLGIPIIEGRTFTTDEERTPGQAIIVSRSFATRWFPEGALGQAVSFTRNDRRTIVGVAEDVHATTLDDDISRPAFYLALTDLFLIGDINTHIVRTSEPVASVSAEATRIFRELDPSASLFVNSAEDAMASPLTRRRLSLNAVVALALLAVALAVVNVYALSAFSVLQRSREIGIRIALGATRTDTLKLIMHRSVVWITCGLAIGAAATIWLARPALRSVLANLPTDEPLLLSIAFVSVSSIAILASWLPARRATSIDPAITLRAE